MKYQRQIDFLQPWTTQILLNYFENEKQKSVYLLTLHFTVIASLAW